MFLCPLLSNRRVLSLLLGMSVVTTASVAQAAVDRTPQRTYIRISHSADFPELHFVVCKFAAGQTEPIPWERVDAAKAKFFPAGSGFLCPAFDRAFAVLAVPREAAEKARGKADPAWLKSSTPGVIRLSEVLRIPRVTRLVTLHYRLGKTDNGPKLTLLNPEALKPVKRAPAVPSTSTPKADSPAGYMWVYYTAGGVLVVALIVFLFIKSGSAAE